MNARAALLDLKTALLRRARLAGFGNEEICAALNVLPVGLEVLIKEPWSFEQAVAFAEACGLKIEIVVS